MNVSYRWLKELAPDLELSVADVADALAGRGAPVEELVNLAEGLEGVVVARVEEAGRHPNADRLSLCRVNAGAEILQVVCGAPNVKAGAYYPFAPVGTTLPGGLKLKKAKIRGEVSEGMLCSPSEIGLGTDHSGILELSGEPEIGASLISVMGLDDWRLDVEVTANRGDMLSHVGVVREVAPSGAASIHLPEIPGAPTTVLELEQADARVSASGASVQIDDPDLCARYIGVVIRGVTVGASPPWLQARLRAVGARPISNVVDATNYVLLELGQPLHAFDLDQLDEHAIVVRRAREGERITTLDGEERKLQRDMLAICDAKVPVAIAGVMGGADSEVSSSTKDVLLECAHFDPAATRRTRRALGMSTDASYRFERGVDPEGMQEAVARCVEIILATAGGVVDGKALDVTARSFEPVALDLRLSRIEQVLGVAFTPEQVSSLLTPLGFAVDTEAGKGVLGVRVPGYRRFDVTREIDLVEEIARTHGYDNFPEQLAPFRPSVVPDHPLFALEERLRTLLVGLGTFELQTPAFASTGEVELPNPVSATESHLRASMVPGVLTRLAYNLDRGIRDVRLFEIGTAFFAPAEQGVNDAEGTPREQPQAKPREETRLAAAFVGRSGTPHWTGSGEEAVDIWDTKAWLETIASMCWPGAEVRVSVAPPQGSWLAPGASLEVWAEGVRVGEAGRVSSAAIDVPPWASSVFALEIVLPADPAPVATPVYQPIARYPGIERDLALLVPTPRTAAEVRSAIEEHSSSLVESVQLFDLYEGEGIEDGMRSLAYRLTFKSPERTLTDEDVEPTVRRILKRLETELNVHHRG